eukprot:CAMPEP_0170558398 /NCGR_PEP_ID=MMETSP0211-20121228/35106_1 /TAXON_ID=311385 /ORGANISM="Pseudokeronopsis sp., Strain OXSARD2" /LENGTH=325 /DNA_ID=CAMNT_0010870287 /DNA_START=183 /DNA_END=1156 /DNA_ORIENTATION=-
MALLLVPAFEEELAPDHEEHRLRDVRTELLLTARHSNRLQQFSPLVELEGVPELVGEVAGAGELFEVGVEAEDAGRGLLLLVRGDGALRQDRHHLLRKLKVVQIQQQQLPLEDGDLDKFTESFPLFCFLHRVPDTVREHPPQVQFLHFFWQVEEFLNLLNKGFFVELVLAGPDEHGDPILSFSFLESLQDGIVIIGSVKTDPLLVEDFFFVSEDLFFKDLGSFLLFLVFVDRVHEAGAFFLVTPHKELHQVVVPLEQPSMDLPIHMLELTSAIHLGLSPGPFIDMPNRPFKLALAFKEVLFETASVNRPIFEDSCAFPMFLVPIP